jgi:hypothetical protein
MNYKKKRNMKNKIIEAIMIIHGLFARLKTGNESDLRRLSAKCFVIKG